MSPRTGGNHFYHECSALSRKRAPMETLPFRNVVTNQNRGRGGEATQLGGFGTATPVRWPCRFLVSIGMEVIGASENLENDGNRDVT